MRSGQRTAVVLDEGAKEHEEGGGEGGGRAGGVEGAGGEPGVVVAA